VIGEQYSEERVFTFPISDEEAVRRRPTADPMVVAWLLVTYARSADEAGWHVCKLEAQGRRARRDGSAGSTYASAVWYRPPASELDALPEWMVKLITAYMPAD